MTIKHLVFSGGGPIMIQFLGAIQTLEKQEYLNMKNIKSIYGTSAGAALGVMLALQFDWDTLTNYIIKRPWHDVFPLNVQNILDCYSKKGLFDQKTIEQCFRPLFNAKDIPMDIQLEDFYNITHIELHFFTFEINQYKLEDVSYKNYPSLPVMTAIQMTCALPVLISPVCMEDKCFMDGGAVCNYPFLQSICEAELHHEILGFKNNYVERKIACDEDSNLFDYLLNFLFKAIFQNNQIPDNEHIKNGNELVCDASYLSFDILNSALSNVDVRRELFEKGSQSAFLYLQEKNNTNDEQK